MFEGLSTVNIELTSRCNKECWMCGRRKIEREYPELANWGDMDYELVQSISRQLPKGIVIQFHDNGEPLMYPRLGEALALFPNQIRCLDTNGKLLMEKADEIIGQLDTITISIIPHDPDAIEQHAILRRFREYKGDRKPIIIGRLLGDVPTNGWDVDIITRRTLHSPDGSFKYKKPPVIPEIGICLEMLHHLSIKRNGDVSVCVRFDPKGDGVIGNAYQTSLNQIWDSVKRRHYLLHHIRGERAKLPLCDKCEYWGCPIG